MYCSSGCGNLFSPDLKNRASGGSNKGLPASDPISHIPAPSLVALCPFVTVKVDGVPQKCLLDMGSMVTTITKSFFREHFQDSPSSHQSLQLQAINGLEIVGYVDYVELDVEVLGKTCLIKVSVIYHPGQKPSPDVPGVLGMMSCVHT